jgi:hypothetical protein
MRQSCEALFPVTEHCRCTRELGHAGAHLHAGSRAEWPRESEQLALDNEDAELGALRACVRNLDGLELAAIERIVGYLQTRFVQKGSSRS